MSNKIFNLLFISTFPRLFASVIIGLAAFGSYDYQRQSEEKTDLEKRIVSQTVLKCDDVTKRDDQFICMEFKK